MNLKQTIFNSFPASGNFFRLLITFANNADPDQVWKNIGPDLDPNCWTLWCYSWEIFFEKVDFKKCSYDKKHVQLPSMQSVKKGEKNKTKNFELSPLKVYQFSLIEEKKETKLKQWKWITGWIENVKEHQKRKKKKRCTVSWNTRNKWEDIII